MRDPSHFIKLVRNSFGEYKLLIDGDGGRINFAYVQQLVDLQEEEGLKLANKLRKQHIQFFKQKMKIKLATQLLSRSVADALQFCNKVMQLPQLRNVDATVRFIKLMNDAFDILNTHRLGGWDLKKQYGKKILQISNYLHGILYVC